MGLVACDFELEDLVLVGVVSGTVGVVRLGGRSRHALEVDRMAMAWRAIHTTCRYSIIRRSPLGISLFKFT